MQEEAEEEEESEAKAEEAEAEAEEEEEEAMALCIEADSVFVGDFFCVFVLRFAAFFPLFPCFFFWLQSFWLV
jgi:F0F1-type ATP synthase assembly protein I